MSRCAAEISGPVSVVGSSGPPRTMRWARSTRSSTMRSCADSSTTSRAPAEHTWPECRKIPVRTLSTAVSWSASAKSTNGFLPPSSSATFLTVAAALAMRTLPVARPPVKLDHVDARIGRQRSPGRRPGAQDEVRDAVGHARLGQQLHQDDRRVRGELARLEDERAAGTERRRHLPRRLEQRVVPGRDQPADPDRLVDDLAARVRDPGLDEAPVVGGGEVAEPAEAVRDVVHVDLGLDDPLPGVVGLGAREPVLVALQQIGDAQQQRPPLGGRDVRPAAVVEGRAGSADGPLGVRGARLADLGDERAVRGRTDLAPAAVLGVDPRAVDVELSHALCLPPSPGCPTAGLIG